MYLTQHAFIFMYCLQSLQVINDNTEVTYNLTAEAGGGLVSSRDFVNIRQWLQLEPGVFISYGTGCIHPDMPVQKKYVRYDSVPWSAYLVLD